MNFYSFLTSRIIKLNSKSYHNARISWGLLPKLRLAYLDNLINNYKARNEPAPILGSYGGSNDDPSSPPSVEEKNEDNPQLNLGTKVLNNQVRRSRLVSNSLTLRQNRAMEARKSLRSLDEGIDFRRFIETTTNTITNLRFDPRSSSLAQRITDHTSPVRMPPTRDTNLPQVRNSGPRFGQNDTQYRNHYLSQTLGKNPTLRLGTRIPETPNRRAAPRKINTPQTGRPSLRKPLEKEFPVRSDTGYTRAQTPKDREPYARVKERRDDNTIGITKSNLRKSLPGRPSTGYTRPKTSLGGTIPSTTKNSLRKSLQGGLPAKSTTKYTRPKTSLHKPLEDESPTKPATRYTRPTTTLKDRRGSNIPSISRNDLRKSLPEGSSTNQPTANLKDRRGSKIPSISRNDLRKSLPEGSPVKSTTRYTRPTTTLKDRRGSNIPSISRNDLRKVIPNTQTSKHNFNSVSTSSKHVKNKASGNAKPS
jgi:hypothetical protein